MKHLKTINEYQVTDISIKGDGKDIFYHGGNNLEGKDINLPIFLTPVKKIAEWYGYQRGGWINEFYLDFNKPLDSVDDWNIVLGNIGIDWDDFNGDMVWQLNRKDSDRENWSRSWNELGGDILDIIYYKPFRESMIKFGYDVIIWEDSGNQDTTGLVYIPLYKDKIHFVKSHELELSEGFKDNHLKKITMFNEYQRTIGFRYSEPKETYNIDILIKGDDITEDKINLGLSKVSELFYDQGSIKINPFDEKTIVNLPSGSVEVDAVVLFNINVYNDKEIPSIIDELREKLLSYFDIEVLDFKSRRKFEV
jgi:hypothetical protein